MNKTALALVIAAVCVGALLSGEYSVYVFAPERPTRIAFVGDMMFDRTMRTIAEREGYEYLLSCTRDYLRGFDMAVGNLEGPITAHPSVSQGKKPGEPDNTRFTFDFAVAAALADAGFGAVSLGNNHIYDFGREGIDSTASALDTVGLLHFGAPGKGDVVTTTVNGLQLAFVAFNQFVGAANPVITETFIRDVRTTADFVTVYAHWGDEYEAENEYQRALARRFIDAGADIVIGSHPHVVQGHEVYKGKHIYYSLGNFIFDQYWEEAVRTGLVVEVSIDQGEVSVSERIIDIARTGLSCLR
ncbi:MAG: CapA family protein [bacterium]|nr:CapA family protein [bacterium]